MKISILVERLHVLLKVLNGIFLKSLNDIFLFVHLDSRENFAQKRNAEKTCRQNQKNFDLGPSIYVQLSSGLKWSAIELSGLCPQLPYFFFAPTQAPFNVHSAMFY